MKIAVLLGGCSTEREVSLISGAEVARALEGSGHEVTTVDPGSDFFAPSVLEECRKADIVFMALHGGDGEDGRIQAALDLLGVPYTGTGHIGSAIAMNKNLTKHLLRQAGVPTADWRHFRRGMSVPDPVDVGLSYPVIIKVNGGGSSVGVYIVERPDQLEEAVREAFALEEEILMETYIPGREFSVGVIDGNALPVIEIAPKTGFYDYKNKYTAGCTVETCPAEISEEARDKMWTYAEETFHALQLGGYGRVDMRMTEEGDVYVLEANTLPGMTPLSLLPQEAAVNGMDFAALCEEIIRVSLKERKGGSQ